MAPALGWAKARWHGVAIFQRSYYDPELGTFISPDTLVPDAGNLFDYNRYMYVRGQTLKYNDPTGHCASASAIDVVCWVALAEAAAAATATLVAGGGAAVTIGVGIYGYQNTTFDLPDYDHSYDVPGTDLQASHPVNGSSTVSSGVPVIQSENEGFTLVDPPSVDSLIVDAGIGSANGERAGQDFTRAGKRAVIQDNMSANGGVTVCENCKVVTVPGQKSQSGITPPVNQTQVDHIIPRVYGGNGSPDNGQVLCRLCNRDKYWASAHFSEQKRNLGSQTAS